LHTVTLQAAVYSALQHFLHSKKARLHLFLSRLMMFLLAFLHFLRSFPLNSLQGCLAALECFFKVSLQDFFPGLHLSLMHCFVPDAASLWTATRVVARRAAITGTEPIL
jgi:hypothetical protein